MKTNKSLANISEKELSYKLRGFTINKFLINEPESIIINNFDINKLKAGISIDYKFENGNFHIWLNIFNNYEIGSKKIMLMELSLITDFHISNYQNIINSENEKFIIPIDFVSTLTGLAYSSARGIIFAKTQGSFLNQFILPVIDPKILIQQNLDSLQNLNENK